MTGSKEQKSEASSQHQEAFCTTGYNLYSSLIKVHGYNLTSLIY